MPQLTILDGKLIWAYPTFAMEYNLGEEPGIVAQSLKELQARRKVSGISRR